MKLHNIGKKVITELKYRQHLIDRIKQRVFNGKPFDVIIHYKSPETHRWVDEYLGEYQPAPEIYQKVDKGYNHLINVTSNSTSEYNVIVKNHVFDLVSEWDNFTFDPQFDKEELDEILQDVKDGYFDLRIRTKPNGQGQMTAGQTLITIIKESTVITTMLSYEKTDEKIESRHGEGRFNIVIDDPLDIEKYINLSPM